MRSLLAHEGALRFFAIRGAVALPVAERLFANGLALGSGICALGVAHRLLAYCVAFRAGTFLTVLHWAADFALRLVTLNSALGAG